MKSVKKNFMWNTLLQFSSLVFPLITYPYISRVIGAEGIGKVSFATSVIAYFSIIAQLGVPTYGIRSCAQVVNNKDELSKTTQEILFISSITTGIAYICLSIAIALIPKFQEDKTLLIITSLQMVFNTIGVVWLFSGLEQYRYITIRSIAFKLVSLVLMFLVVSKREDYLIYATIQIIAIVGSNILNLFYSRKFVSYKRYKQYDFKRHIKPIFVFFSMSVATTVYTSLDTIMLGFMKSDSEVGFYTSATKIRSVLLGLINALATVLLPRASFYIKNGMRKEFVKISQKAFHFIVIIGLAMWAYFSLFAEESILVLSGKGFVSAVYPMRWIMPTVLICGISNLTAIEMLVALGKEKIVLRTQITGALIDFILNLLFIPYYGASAAAGATMIAEVVIMILQILALHKEGIHIGENIKYWKIIVSLSFAMVGVYFIKLLMFTPLLCLTLSFVIFITLYTTILIILKEDFAMEVFVILKSIVLHISNTCKK